MTLLLSERERGEREGEGRGVWSVSDNLKSVTGSLISCSLPVGPGGLARIVAGGRPPLSAGAAAGLDIVAVESTATELLWVDLRLDLTPGHFAGIEIIAEK